MLILLLAILFILSQLFNQSNDIPQETRVFFMPMECRIKGFIYTTNMMDRCNYIIPYSIQIYNFILQHQCQMVFSTARNGYCRTCHNCHPQPIVGVYNALSFQAGIRLRLNAIAWHGERSLSVLSCQYTQGNGCRVIHS